MVEKGGNKKWMFNLLIRVLENSFCQNQGSLYNAKKELPLVHSLSPFLAELVIRQWDRLDSEKEKRWQERATFLVCDVPMLKLY